MKNILIVILFLTTALTGSCFAKCGTVTPGKTTGMGNFTCYTGTFYQCDGSDGPTTCFQYTSKTNLDLPDLTTKGDGGAPECGITDSRVANPDSDNKDKVSHSKLIALCQEVAPKTNYIYATFGFNKIGPNTVDDHWYPKCTYTEDGTSWVYYDRSHCDMKITKTDD